MTVRAGQMEIRLQAAQSLRASQRGEETHWASLRLCATCMQTPMSFMTF